MRLTITLAFGLLVFYGCNRSASTGQTGDENKTIISVGEYKPDPDEIVISAKLISYEDGVANVEVVEQLKTGFSAKVIFTPGTELSLSSKNKPADNFICALESSDSMGQKTYRITRFLK